MSGVAAGDCSAGQYGDEAGSAQFAAIVADRLVISRPPAFAGMHAGGWPDVAVNSRMIIVVEPSGTL